MRECVRACVHDEEPYAPQAKIRTEMAAITVAERWHERDGHIHHPRSFEYRGAERRTRRDDKRERVGGKMEGKERRLRREGRNERRGGRRKGSSHTRAAQRGEEYLSKREKERCLGLTRTKKVKSKERRRETGYRRGKHAKVMLPSVPLFVTTKCRESSRIWSVTFLKSQLLRRGKTWRTRRGTRDLNFSLAIERSHRKVVYSLWQTFDE